MGYCRSTGCKVISCQSWQFEKNSAAQPESNSGSPGSADWQNFFQTANFDSLSISLKRASSPTLRSEINVGSGINVGVGRF